MINMGLPTIIVIFHFVRIEFDKPFKSKDRANTLAETELGK